MEYILTFIFIKSFYTHTHTHTCCLSKVIFDLYGWIR